MNSKNISATLGTSVTNINNIGFPTRVLITKFTERYASRRKQNFTHEGVRHIRYTIRNQISQQEEVSFLSSLLPQQKPYSSAIVTVCFVLQWRCRVSEGLPLPDGPLCRLSSPSYSPATQRILTVARDGGSLWYGQFCDAAFRYGT